MSVVNRRLISPPISPQGKFPNVFPPASAIYGEMLALSEQGPRPQHQKEAIQDEQSELIERYCISPEHDGKLVMKPLTKKNHLVNFLTAYYVRQNKPIKQSKRSTKKRSTAIQSATSHFSSNISSSSSADRSTNEAQDTPNSFLLQTGLFGDDSNSSSARHYVTRSRKRGSSDDSEEASNKRRFNKSNEASGADFVFQDKISFLVDGSVQYVHDSLTYDIPDFIPGFSNIKHETIENVLKKIGLSVNNELKEKHGLDKIDKKEIIIVTSLKLTPEQYYDTKRRFFAEKSRKTYLKSTFKKTDAQKACRIDVNKTSKLFETFQVCGLLDDKLYQD